MQRVLSTFLIFFFLLAVSSCNQSQITTQNETPKDWKKIETDYFSFSIPPTIKENNVQGIDSSVMQFENDEITLDIEYGDYSMDLIPYLQDYEGQKDKIIIDGEKTEIVSYDRNKPINLSNRMVNADGSTKLIEPEKNYIFGVNFPHKNEIISPGDRPAISLVLKSRKLENQKIAKTIFYSVKFKQK